MGAGALNQAIKAVAIARGYVPDSGIDLVCVPTFADIEIDGERRTAIRLLIEDRDRRRPVGLELRTTRRARGRGSGRPRGRGGAGLATGPTVAIAAALRASAVAVA